MRGYIFVSFQIKEPFLG